MKLNKRILENILTDFNINKSVYGRETIRKRYCVSENEARAYLSIVENMEEISDFLSLQTDKELLVSNKK